MIFSHSHLNKQLTKQKVQHTISHQSPLCIIVSKTFLSRTLQDTLKLKKIPFIKKTVQAQVLMQHKLPLLMYQNTLLSEQQIVQFLADIWLTNFSYQQYIQRKQICLQFYNRWAKLVNEQSKGLKGFKVQNANIIKGIKSKQDYFNYVFSGFHLLSSQINSNLLQNIYDHYKRTQTNLQNLLAHDLIQTICNQCPATMLDHILRGHFVSLLENSQSINKIIENQNQNAKQYEIHQIKVYTDEKVQPKVQNSHFSFNWKRFILGFSVLSGVYYLWGDK